MIAWDPSLATGDAMIDRQHQELYRIVNELHTACNEGHTDEQIDRALSWLLSYTIEHFAAEEDLMVRSEYPALSRDEHVGEHDAFKAQVDGLLGQRRRGELTAMKPVAELVRTWLDTHINCLDRRLAEHVHSE